MPRMALWGQWTMGPGSGPGSLEQGGEVGAGPPQWPFLGLLLCPRGTPGPGREAIRPCGFPTVAAEPMAPPSSIHLTCPTLSPWSAPSSVAGIAPPLGTDVAVSCS